MEKCDAEKLLSGAVNIMMDIEMGDELRAAIEAMVSYFLTNCEIKHNSCKTIEEKGAFLSLVSNFLVKSLNVFVPHLSEDSLCDIRRLLYNSPSNPEKNVAEK